MTWQEHAACRGVDADLFYPARGETDVVREARAICASCPVQQACLDYALANGEKFGIWGGLSERERRELRRKNPRPRRLTPQRCGTPNGYRQHRYRGEPSCVACKDAYRCYRDALRNPVLRVVEEAS